MLDRSRAQTDAEGSLIIEFCGNKEKTRLNDPQAQGDMDVVEVLDLESPHVSFTMLDSDFVRITFVLQKVEERGLDTKP